MRVSIVCGLSLYIVFCVFCRTWVVAFRFVDADQHGVEHNFGVVGEVRDDVD